MLVPTQKIPDTQESQNELIFTPTQKAPELVDEEDGEGQAFLAFGFSLAFNHHY